MKRVALLLALCGCVDTIGPFVRDVSPNHDGSIRVRYCSVELHRGFIVGYSLEESDCFVRNVKEGK